ncbi:MAG: hypothetical protein GX654_03030 [Desulfatiglans sp.]|nr:hypothetical protein [Desulfatiglans sp.]
MKIPCNHDKNLNNILQKRTNYYALIRGPSYGSLDFVDREEIRTAIREKLESHGIRFQEYTWVWDEDDRCLLLVGTFENEEEANQCIKRYESMGFKTCIKTSLSGSANI